MEQPVTTAEERNADKFNTDAGDSGLLQQLGRLRCGDDLR